MPDTALNKRAKISGQRRRLIAARIRNAETSAQIELAWNLALGRAPTEDEVAESTRLLKELATAPGAPLEDPPPELAELSPAEAVALTEFCLTLFNLNEFVYVD